MSRPIGRHIDAQVAMPDMNMTRFRLSIRTDGGGAATEPPRLKDVESQQVPRWVFALARANADPTTQDDSPKARGEYLKRTRELYERRKARREDDGTTSSRVTGLEWRARRRFSQQEYNQALGRLPPLERTRRAAGTALVAGFTGLGALVLLACLALLTHALIEGPDAWWAATRRAGSLEAVLARETLFYTDTLWSLTNKSGQTRPAALSGATAAASGGASGR